MKVSPRGPIGLIGIGIALALASLAVTACADIRLPRVFSDHMVLQRNAPIRVWGWADPGEALTVILDEQSVPATADDSGAWRAELEAMEFGGPYELTVQGEQASVVFKNVMVGEVWVCSGQSNMHWSVAQTVDGTEEQRQAFFHGLKEPRLRLFQVEETATEKLTDDFTKDESWQLCEPENGSQFSAVAYHFGRQLLEQLEADPRFAEQSLTIGLINTSWGGSACEAWISDSTMTAEPSLKPLLDHFASEPPSKAHPSSLFNGMIAPLTRMSIRGAIWYQGESNVGRAHQFATLFPLLIADWRKQFDQGDFPFFYVQLAPYRYGDRDTGDLPEIWDVQRKALEIPNTGMVVTTDIGDIGDIHPKNKREVGRRLALWALANVYGFDQLVHSGPLLESVEIEGGCVTLKFSHVAEGLFRPESADSDFLICGKDQKFVPAVAEIRGDSIVVSSADVAEPVAVRFGWADTATPTLQNSIGLPASPFRTDTFKSDSEGRHF